MIFLLHKLKAYIKKKSFSLLCYINIFLRGNNTDDQTTALYVKGQTMKKNLLIKNSYLK